jgi:hypothetical protein
MLLDQTTLGNLIMVVFTINPRNTAFGFAEVLSVGMTFAKLSR